MVIASNQYRDQITRPSRNAQYIRIKVFNHTYNRNNQTFENDIDSLLKIDTSVPLLPGAVNIQLQTSQWNNEVDPLGSKLPQETFSFTFVDVDRVYDPEIPHSKNDNNNYNWAALEQQRPIAWWYGYELDVDDFDNLSENMTVIEKPNKDKTVVEWIKGSTYLTTGEVNWDNNGTLPKVTIEAKSVLSYLGNDTFKVPSGTTNFRDIAQGAMSSTTLSAIRPPNNWFQLIARVVDLPASAIYRFFSPTDFENIELPINQVLQLIAQAAGCLLRTNRHGDIEISKFSGNVEQYYRMGGESLKVIPSLHKYPILRNVSIEADLFGNNRVNIFGQGNANFDEPSQYFCFSREAVQIMLGLSINDTAAREDELWGEFLINTQRRIPSDDGLPLMTSMRDVANVKVTDEAEVLVDRGRTWPHNEVSARITGAARESTGGWKSIPECEYEILRPTWDSIRIRFKVLSNTSRVAFRFTGTEIFPNQVIPCPETLDPNAVGVPVQLENPFLTNRATAENFADYAKSILEMRNLYDGADNRGFPEIDPGDGIYTETNYHFHLPVVVLANNITFDGSFKGTMKYLAHNIDDDTLFGLRVNERDDRDYNNPLGLERNNNQILTWREKRNVE